MQRAATFSKEEKPLYRYQLTREWDSTLPKVAFVGLNPSWADEQKDDATIRRCIAIVKEMKSYGGFYMVNLFVCRTEKPKKMKLEEAPIGPENDLHLKKIFSEVEKVICVWGNDGKHKGRDKEVLALIEKPYCLMKNKNGSPRHPLYVSSKQELAYFF